jgi:hypothetical protein
VTPDRERGVALVLALLALALITFMALGLALVTSTELQAATNYRWQRQAFYNAEGALEAGRALLADMSWPLVLPPARPGWIPGAGPRQPPLAPFLNARNFELGECDGHGNGVGYGVVLDDGGGPPSPFDRVGTISGQQMNGAATLWIRRPLVDTPPFVRDDTHGDVLVLTAEGTAPWIAPGTDLHARPYLAWRVLEATLRRRFDGVRWTVRIEGLRMRSSACAME